MATRKNVLTTGEVAKLCNVAPRTVSKWFDSGQLRGYRIPGSKDRRIPIDQLIRFMQAHGIPLNGLEGEARRLLVFDPDTAFRDSIRKALTQDGEFEVAVADSAFEAGALAVEFKPHLVLVDVSQTEISPKAISQCVRTMPALRELRLVGMAPNLTQAQGKVLMQDGFDAFLSKPFEARTLARLAEPTSNGSTRSPNEEHADA